MSCQVAAAGLFLCATPRPPSGLIPHLAGGSVPKPGDEQGLIPEHQSITLRPGPRWKRQDGRQVSSCLQSAGVVNHAFSRPASPHMCFSFLSSPHPSTLFLALYISDSLSPSCISCGDFFLCTVWFPNWNHVDTRKTKKKIKTACHPNEVNRIPNYLAGKWEAPPFQDCSPAFPLSRFAACFFYVATFSLGPISSFASKAPSIFNPSLLVRLARLTPACSTLAASPGSKMQSFSQISFYTLLHFMSLL